VEVVLAFLFVENVKNILIFLIEDIIYQKMRENCLLTLRENVVKKAMKTVVKCFLFNVLNL